MEADRRGAALEIAVHGHGLAAYKPLLDREDWAGVGRLILASAQALANAGASLLVMPDNTIHAALEGLSLPRPLLHIADTVTAEARRLGLRRMAILGTRQLMEGPVYGSRLMAAGMEMTIPTAEERAELDQLIYQELVLGVVSDRGRAFLTELARRMQARGCDGIGLCCTELPLALATADSPVPLLDSTRLLARAAVAAALSPDPPAT